MSNFERDVANTMLDAADSRTAHEKTRIRQLEDASAHWERKYANARQYNRNLEERIAALEARCVAAEQAEANAFRNRDSAVAENEKFRAMLEKIEGSSRPRGEPAWQYDEIRALLGMPTASETQDVTSLDNGDQV